MLRFPRLQAGFVLFLIWESGCQHKQVVVPLPTPPAASLPAAPAPAPSAVPETKPSSSASAPAAPRAQQPDTYQLNKPAQPAAAPKKPIRPAAPAPAPAPSAEPATPPAPPTPAPKLGDVLSANEQRQYNAAIDQSLSRAQTSLNSVGTRQLDKDQQAQVQQIRNFMQQAQSTRNSDPTGAKSLAERAEVLARDLAASLP
jgi:hypothetical protein